MGFIKNINEYWNISENSNFYRKMFYNQVYKSHIIRLHEKTKALSLLHNLILIVDIAFIDKEGLFVIWKSTFFQSFGLDIDLF